MRARVSKEEQLQKARIRSNRWYHSHKHEIREKNRARSKKYYYAHKHIKMSPRQWKLRLEYQKRWRAKNHEKTRSYECKQSQANIQRSIKQRLCTRIRTVLARRNIRKTDKTIELIGCTWASLQSHIESLFLPGMSWENRSLWHIDHVRPCASFDLRNPSQLRACFHFLNLEPMWSDKNMSKGAKWKI